MQAAGVCGSLLDLDANEFSHVGSNAIGANDCFVLSGRAIVESDRSVLGVNIDNLCFVSVIVHIE